MITEPNNKASFVTDLDAFFVVDSADHPDTHLRDLVELWLLHADVTEYLDDPFTHTDASVLQRAIHMISNIS